LNFTLIELLAGPRCCAASDDQQVVPTPNCGAPLETSVPFYLMALLEFVQPGGDTGPKKNPVWKARY
jgi:hypothetical protein